MRNLFTIDLKDYNDTDVIYKRPSSRAIIIKDGKIALVYSNKHNYYKFPGGGINESEDKIDALIREVKEEVGLIVIKNSIKEYGEVKRIQKSNLNQIFYQENYYYLCDVENDLIKQNLDKYEQDEEFILKYVDPQTAIITNYNHQDNLFRKTMIDRDAKVLEILVKEGII
jgi:8-oxo-dGTP pyrophosphatase MutT (NUDIX family)